MRGKTSQKKLPLVIHIDDGGMMVLNKTCRYCPGCDLLIADKDEGFEPCWRQYFQRTAREVVGNDYLVVGTVDRADWRRGMEGDMTPQDMIKVLHDFKDVVQFKFVGGFSGPEGRERPNDNSPEAKIDAKLQAVTEAMTGHCRLGSVLGRR